MRTALDRMTQAGATIVEVNLIEVLKNEAEEFELLKYEFKDGLNKYLANANSRVKSLEELIQYNKDSAKVMMPYFGQDILEASQEKQSLDTDAYHATLQKVTATKAVIDSIMNSNKLDAICGPTNGPTWCTDLINGDHFTGYGMYSPAAMAGYPSISVPMGMVHGLPVGLCFIAGAFKEGELLAVAYGYEQLSMHRVKPSYLS